MPMPPPPVAAAFVVDNVATAEHNGHSHTFITSSLSFSIRFASKKKRKSKLVLSHIPRLLLDEADPMKEIVCRSVRTKDNGQTKPPLFLRQQFPQPITSFGQPNHAMLSTYNRFFKVTIVVLAILVTKSRIEKKVHNSSFSDLLPLASFKDVFATFSQVSRMSQRAVCRYSYSNCIPVVCTSITPRRKTFRTTKSIT